MWSEVRKIKGGIKKSEFPHIKQCEFFSWSTVKLSRLTVMHTGRLIYEKSIA